jgi:hypothetical protein
MSKILLTGMTAPQASENANARSLGFVGILNAVLSDAGHEVTWISPSVHMTKESLEQFDCVVVGVTPVTSVGASRAYGALSIIDHMWGNNKLVLLIDGPNSSQIDPSLKTVLSNPASLTKSFFSNRKEYSTVLADLAISGRLHSAINHLINDEWPTTIYSALPWSVSEDVKLAPNAKKNLVPVNLDSYLIYDNQVAVDRRQKWVVDNPGTPWSVAALKTLLLPNSLMRWNKGWDDDQVMDQFTRSIGALITSHKKDGTWWSYRYIQALNSNTPVATEWKFSSRIGVEWSTLPAAIESMSQMKRDLLASAQRDRYVANIPAKDTALKNLETVLNISRKEN